MKKPSFTSFLASLLSPFRTPWDFLLRILRIKALPSFLKKYKNLLALFCAALLLSLAVWISSFELDTILESKKSLLDAVEDRPLSSALLFFLFYLTVFTLSLPAALPLSLIGGFLFGFSKGALLSLFSASLGSSLSFLLVRFFLYDFFLKRGGLKVQKLRSRFKKDELYYLFALRTLPFIPSFFTNIVMGLSSIKLTSFYAVSFVAFSPALLIYTNIGSKLSSLESLQGLGRPSLIFAISLAGLFPLVSRQAFRLLKKFKKTNEELSLAV